MAPSRAGAGTHPFSGTLSGNVPLLAVAESLLSLEPRQGTPNSFPPDRRACCRVARSVRNPELPDYRIPRVFCSTSRLGGAPN